MRFLVGEVFNKNCKLDSVNNLIKNRKLDSINNLIKNCKSDRVNNLIKNHKLDSMNNLIKYFLKCWKNAEKCWKTQVKGGQFNEKRY